MVAPEQLLKLKVAYLKALEIVFFVLSEQAVLVVFRVQVGPELAFDSVDSVEDHRHLSVNLLSKFIEGCKAQL